MSVAVPVGIVQVPLHRPSATVPPVPVGEKGRFGSAVPGTTIVRMMFEGLTTFTERLVSATMTPPTTIPTLVFSVGSVPPTKPVPVRTTGNDVPETAVGRLAGLRPLRVAPGDTTVRLMVTTVVDAGLPQVNVTVPVSTVPGCAVAKINELNVTPICVPKL